MLLNSYSSDLTIQNNCEYISIQSSIEVLMNLETCCLTGLLCFRDIAISYKDELDAIGVEIVGVEVDMVDVVVVVVKEFNLTIFTYFVIKNKSKK